MDRPDDLGRLPSGDYSRINELADRFEKLLQDAEASGTEVDLTSLLPRHGDPLRSSALNELIKIDMEFRCRRGQPYTLDEYYLKAYPELGLLDSLPPHLVHWEYHVNRRYGANVPLSEYQKRYPRQYEAVKKIVDSADQETRAPEPPPSSRSSSGSGLIPRSGGAVGSGLLPRPQLGGSQEAGATVSGGYTLQKRIGSGAFGEVWRATAPGGVEVAVKIIFRPLDNEEAKSELHAMELIKTLRHPFLLQTHAFWPEQDRLLIVMELADGSLRDRLKHCKKQGMTGIPLKELLNFFSQAAQALDYLHGRRLLHRDIKPDNILMCEGYAKVADFGLARLMSTRRSAKVTGSGTPAYMAPEMWASQPNQFSDQYCFATTYAELRLAKPLFQGQDIIQLMRAHLQDKPDLVGLPPREQEVLLKALAKDPQKRFASCGEFVHALSGAVDTAGVRKEVGAPSAPPRKSAPQITPHLVTDDWQDYQGTIRPGVLPSPVMPPPEEPAEPGPSDTDSQEVATLRNAGKQALEQEAEASPAQRPGWRDVSEKQPRSTHTGAPVPTRKAQPSHGRKVLLAAALAAVVLVGLVVALLVKKDSFEGEIEKLVAGSQFADALDRIDQAGFLQAPFGTAGLRHDVQQKWHAKLEGLLAGEQYPAAEQEANKLLARIPTDEEGVKYLDNALRHNAPEIVSSVDLQAAYRRLEAASSKSAERQKLLTELHDKWRDQIQAQYREGVTLNRKFEFAKSQNTAPARQQFAKARAGAQEMLTSYKDDPLARDLRQRAAGEIVRIDLSDFTARGKFPEAFKIFRDGADLPPDADALWVAVLKDLVRQVQNEYADGKVSQAEQGSRLALDTLKQVVFQTPPELVEQLNTWLVLSYAGASRPDAGKSEDMLARFNQLFKAGSSPQMKDLAAAYVRLADSSLPNWRKSPELIKGVVAKLDPADRNPLEQKIVQWSAGDAEQRWARAQAAFQEHNYEACLTAIQEALALQMTPTLSAGQEKLVFDVTRATVEEAERRTQALDVLARMKAFSGLSDLSRKRVEAYHAYLSGRSESNGERAADHMVTAYQTAAEVLPPEWAAPAMTRVQAAADRVSVAKGNLLAPFPPGQADKVFRWLNLERSLRKADLPLPAQAKLALAAAYKSAAPSPLLARALVDQVRARGTTAVLGDAELPLLLARARAQDTAEQKLLAYAQLLGWNHKKAAVADKEWFLAVLKPAAQAGDALPDPQPDVKSVVARCFGAYARFLRIHGNEDLIKGNADQQALEYYTKARKLAPEKSDYLIGCIYSQDALDQINWVTVAADAEEAVRLGPDNPAAYGLKGYVYLLLSRRQTDPKKRFADLSTADAALKKASESGKDHDELPLFLLNRSITDLSLANWYHRLYPGKLEDCKKYLDQARDFAKQAAKSPQAHPEYVQVAWGFALEDIALFLPDETDQYPEAIKKFEAAIGMIKGFSIYAQPWIGMGRTKYRWAASGANKDPKLLVTALDDLDGALKRDPFSAEAYYWKAQIYLKQADFSKALAAYSRTVEVGAKRPSGFVWASLALDELVPNDALELKRKDPKQRMEFADKLIQVVNLGKNALKQDVAAGYLSTLYGDKATVWLEQVKAAQGEAQAKMLAAANDASPEAYRGQLLLKRANLLLDNDTLRTELKTPRSQLVDDLKAAEKLIGGNADKALAMYLAAFADTNDVKDNAANENALRKDAVACARKAIELDSNKEHPDRARMRLLLGINLYYLGDFPNAKTAADEAAGMPGNLLREDERTTLGALRTALKQN